MARSRRHSSTEREIRKWSLTTSHNQTLLLLPKSRTATKNNERMDLAVNSFHNRISYPRILSSCPYLSRHSSACYTAAVQTIAALTATFYPSTKIWDNAMCMFTDHQLPTPEIPQLTNKGHVFLSFLITSGMHLLMHKLSSSGVGRQWSNQLSIELALSPGSGSAFW